MGKKQEDSRGKQKGAQQHAEGQHGERTHERFLEEIQADAAPDKGATFAVTLPNQQLAAAQEFDEPL